MKLSQRINKTNSIFFEKISKIDKPLAKLNKRKWEKTPINKIRYEKWDLTTNTNEIPRIIREYFKNFFLLD
jgi:putative heme iron utilization protein